VLGNGPESLVIGQDLLEGGGPGDHGEPVEIFVGDQVVGMQELVGCAVAGAGLGKTGLGGYENSKATAIRFILVIFLVVPEKNKRTTRNPGINKKFNIQ
jgi:hypothetical protein